MTIFPRLALAASLLLPVAPVLAQAPATHTVYAAGDIAQCFISGSNLSFSWWTAGLIERALASDPQALVLTLGDNAYGRGTRDEFEQCYGASWGRFKDRTWPSPGNHEYATPGATGYFGYFGPRAGRGYYSVRVGNWHIISLDSNLSGPALEAQNLWLRDELAAVGSRCTLAYWHHPLYSSGGHGGSNKMRQAWELLQAAGAEIVLSGHDHDYERFAPQDAHGRLDPERGIRQFVVGTGGALPRPFLWAQPNSEARDSGRFGVLRLRLGEDGYEWTFLEALRNGLPVSGPPDAGSGRCH